MNSEHTLTNNIACEDEEDITPLISSPTDVMNNRSNDQVSHVLLATFIAAIGPLNFGYALGYTSPIQSKLEDTSREFYLTVDEFSWFAALVAVGAMVGSVLGGWGIDRFGRKTTLLMTSVPYVIGWLLISYAQHVAMMFCGRIFVGVAVGVSSLVVPVYISEISSPRLRGGMCSINQLAVTLGLLISYLIGWKLSWRWAAIFPVALVCALVLLMVWMPETPRWLLANGKRHEAIKQLEWLRGPFYAVEAECFEIESNLDQQETISMREFTEPKLYRPLVVACLLMFFQQLVGINAVLFFNQSIFDGAGLHNAALVSICVVLAQVAATVLSCFIVDRTGRRILLMIGSVGMATCTIALGVYFDLVVTSDKSAISVFGHVSHTIPVSQISWLAITSVVVYIILFSLGWGPLPWTLMAEIFPPRARGIASGITTLTNWMFVFVVTKSFADMKDSLHEQGTFWLFAGFSLLSFFFVLFGVFETKGKTLEQIEQHYSRQ